MPEARRIRGFLNLLPLLALLLGFLAQPAAASSDAHQGIASDDGTWNLLIPGELPGKQDGQATVRDPIRNRMIIFGGWDGQNSSNTTRWLGLNGPPVWGRIDPVGSRPPARYVPSMVYDSLRDRLIIFGGRDEFGWFGDVWALNLTGPPVWTELTPAGTPPSARFGHEAIYDPVRDRMLVFLGYDGQFQNDLWELSLAGTPTWTQLSPAGTPPSLRDYTASIYDPVGDRVVLFGGNEFTPPNNIFPVNDTWTLSLSGTPTWAPLPTVGSPPPRILHKAAYDSANQRMLIMGGWDGATWRNNTFALTLTGPPTWTNLNAATPPSPRSDHCFAYDPVNLRAVVYGGRDLNNFFDDTYSLQLTGVPHWTRLHPKPATQPESRLLHKGDYDPLRRQFVVSSGYSYEFDWLSDLWACSIGNPPSWTRLDGLSVQKPSPRSDHVLVADPPADRMIFFGGRDLDNFYNDLWQFDLASGQWSPLVAAGTPPSPRDGMTALFDPLRDRMLMFGGWNGSNALNEVWELTLGATPTWTQLTPTGGPPAGRYAHSMVYDSNHDRLVVFNGRDASGIIDEVWTLSLGPTPHWSLVPATGGPPPRHADGMVYDPVRDRLVVFGGVEIYFSSLYFLNTTWALPLNVANPVWTELHPGGALPKRRDYHTVMYDALMDRLVSFGGNDGVQGYDDTWTLDWMQVPTPTLLSLADEQIAPGAVKLTWFTPDGEGQQATAYRRAEDSEWAAVGALVSDASGQFVLEDRIASGGRYAYRLGLAGGTMTEEHWVSIPGTLAFALGRSWPNPSSGPMSVSFTLPDVRPASLDLLDVRGRRVLHREVGTLGAGAHVVELSGGSKLAPGIYLIQLTQGERIQRTKVAIIR